MVHQNPNAAINPLPAVVWLLLAAIAIPEALFQLASAGVIGGPAGVGWRIGALERFGFSREAFDFMLEQRRVLPRQLLGLVSYPFIQSDFTAFVMAGVILLAMGKMVGEVLAAYKVIMIFMGASIFGAISFGLLSNERWLIGAFPGVYGLIGGYTFLLWRNLAAKGGQQIRAFYLIGVLMAVQLVFGLLFATGDRWIADFSGFLAGFAICTLATSAGRAKLLAYLRKRSV